MVGRFHAVSIRCQSNACKAAKELTDIRFLSEEAPELPLSGCTNRSGCRCRYRHHEDRRIDYRRDADFGLPLRVLPFDDRRQSRGRRASDRANA